MESRRPVAVTQGKGSDVVDLSRPIHAGMMVYPGDPPVDITEGLTLDRDGVEVARLSCGTHTGTHLDAPSHSVPEGRTTSQIPLEELIGPAQVVHLEATPARGLVSATALADSIPLELPRIVFLAFGWDRFFGTEEALNHPALDAAAAELLWSRGMRILGTDALSPDLTRTDPTGPAAPDMDSVGAAPAGAEQGAGFPVHELVLGRDGLIVENLTGLGDLPAGECYVGIFPLPVSDVDGAPARVVAWL